MSKPFGLNSTRLRQPARDAYPSSAKEFSPIEYLIRLRVMRGAELLRQGRLNVTETAFQTGFNDSNYFSRKFREVMGLRPRQFVLCQNINVDMLDEDKAATLS